MRTLVEYTDRLAPLNAYPHRLISPTHPGPCCHCSMAFLSEELRDGQVVFRYKRCLQCGYTVRHILREVPDVALLAALRQELAVAFSRLDYDLSSMAAEAA